MSIDTRMNTTFFYYKEFNSSRVALTPTLITSLCNVFRGLSNVFGLDARIGFKAKIEPGRRAVCIRCLVGIAEDNLPPRA